MIDIHALLDAIRSGQVIPFAFDLGDRPASLTLRHVRPSRFAHGERFVCVYAVSRADLTVSLRVDHDTRHRLLHFQPTFRADGDVDTPIRNVRIFTMDFEDDPTNPIRFRGFNGGANFSQHSLAGEFPRREFAHWDRDLAEGAVQLEETEGRSSLDFLPIWFLHRPDGGMWLGPEWSGTWKLWAGRVGKRQRTVGIRLSLPRLDFVMYQGEEYAMPVVTAQGYAGDVWEGCASLRRAIRDAICPSSLRRDGAEAADSAHAAESGRAAATSPAGEPDQPGPPVIWQQLTGLATELDAAGIAREADLCDRLGVEAFVFASVWYRSAQPHTWFPPDWGQIDNIYTGRREWGNWWERNGDWIPHPSRFPDGMKTFADALAEKGMTLGLWYDPRISRHTRAYGPARHALAPFQADHEKTPIWNMGLIDFGRAEGRALMLDVLERFIEEYGARWLWHDLNVEPRQRYWDHAEAPHRRGLMELRYIHGMHEVYETIIARHRDVVIEWCASGGTMIDLGSLRRSHILWVCDHVEMMATQGDTPHTDDTRLYRSRLNWILPASRIFSSLYCPGPLCDSDRPMGMHNWLTQFGGAFGIGVSPSLFQWKQQDVDDCARAIEVYKQVRHLLDREYRQITPMPQSAEDWDGWQFHDPDTGEGILLVFKMHRCERTSQELTPRFIDPDRVTFEPLLGEVELVPASTGLTARMDGMAALVRYRAS